MAQKRDFTIRLEGDKALERALRQLPANVAKKVQRRAVVAGARVILRQAKANAPKRFGHLRRSLRIRNRWYKRTNTVIAIVGPSTKYARPAKGGHGNPIIAKPNKYAHLVEYGTRPHPIGKGAKLGGRDGGGSYNAMHPGTRPVAFMRRALFSKGRQALDVVRSKMAEGIEQEAAKLGRGRRAG